MAKKWIAQAIKRPGALRKKADAKDNIPAGKLSEMAKEKGRTGQQARLAVTLKKIGRRKRR